MSLKKSLNDKIHSNEKGSLQWWSFLFGYTKVKLNLFCRHQILLLIINSSLSNHSTLLTKKLKTMQHL